MKGTSVWLFELAAFVAAELDTSSILAFSWVWHEAASQSWFAFLKNK